jgi:mRNA interferase MazF
MFGAKYANRSAGSRAGHTDTTSLQGTRFEVAIQTRFLKGIGAFDAQQVLIVPQVKLIRKLGNLQPPQLALVERVLRDWLGL